MCDPGFSKLISLERRTAFLTGSYLMRQMDRKDSHLVGVVRLSEINLEAE